MRLITTEGKVEIVLTKTEFLEFYKPYKQTIEWPGINYDHPHNNPYDVKYDKELYRQVLEIYGLLEEETNEDGTPNL